eukprot:187862_1
MATLQLIITCADGIKGTLDVRENDTLADVRTQMYEELDADLILPSFGFHINGNIRISKKQEKKKKAWDLLDEDLSIQLKGQPKGAAYFAESIHNTKKANSNSNGGVLELDSSGKVTTSNGLTLTGKSLTIKISPADDETGTSTGKVKIHVQCEEDKDEDEKMISKSGNEEEEQNEIKEKDWVPVAKKAKKSSAESIFCIDKNPMATNQIDESFMNVESLT